MFYILHISIKRVLKKKINNNICFFSSHDRFPFSKYGSLLAKIGFFFLFGIGVKFIVIFHNTSTLIIWRKLYYATYVSKAIIFEKKFPLNISFFFQYWIFLLKLVFLVRYNSQNWHKFLIWIKKVLLLVYKCPT